VEHDIPEGCHRWLTSTVIQHHPDSNLRGTACAGCRNTIVTAEPVNIGEKDKQSVRPGGGRAIPPRITGVQVVELGNVLTRSGWMMELFRKDWDGIEMTPLQVNWVQLNSNGVTDWHRHAQQTDHLIGVGGNIRLALWDGREGSPTCRQSDLIRLGALRPVLVTVPPGVWHALRNESGEPAGYINVIDRLYDHGNPDNWRLSPDADGIPDIL
jgi:dTDP-4-dehydrorhamnose 3,5-epimerase